MENLGYKILVSIPGYEILRELGRGGMSTVYLAVQESLQRELALKVVSPTLSVDPSFKDRFMREGRTLGQLSHPNIVIVYDIGLSANRYFIAMEYVGGGTLGELIQQGLSLTHSVRIIKAIARALHYAHRRGFVHRDVKPSNILFREDGTPVLADFGIARSVDATTRLTKTGLSVGTPNYMSPEQVAGQKLDGRSDLYSLGIVFYEMLTGRRPYDGESAIATSLKHLTEPVPTLPQRLSFLQSLMERMLAKAPADRFSDEQEFIEALDNTIAANDRDKPPSEQSLPSEETLLYDENRDVPERAGELRPASQPKPSSQTDSRTGTQVWLAAIKRHPRWKLSAALGTAGVLAAVAAILVSQSALDPGTQRAVDHLLRIAERYMSDGQLTAPEGFNAYETYHDILEIVPDYKKALTGLGQIAQHFESAARAKRKAGAPEESLKLIAQGLKVDPEHDGLLGLRDQITRQAENEKRQRKIAALLAKGDQQFGDWRLVEPAGDNSAESYRAVLQLDGKNPQALQGLKRIADRLESLARTKQSGGDLRGALEDVKKGLKVNSQHQGLQALKQYLTIEILIATAAQQQRNDRLTSPPGENAFETYQQVLNAQPTNEQAQQARAGLRGLAVRLTALAKRDWEAGQVAESLGRLDTGLRLFQGLPGHEELQVLQDKIKRQQKITTLLADATEQFKESKLFEPKGNSALASYQEVLALEPNNPKALEGLKAIADRQETVAKRAEAEGNLDRALAAITLGRKALEDHPSLVSLESKVRNAIQMREGREKRLERLRAQAEEQLAAARFTLPAGNNAYERYKEMLAIEPGSDAAKRGIQAMVRTLEEQAREKQRAGALQKSLSLVEEACKVGAENPGLLPSSLSQELLEFRQALLDQIETRKVEWRIAALLDHAHAQLKADKLTTPPGDNAEASYRKVLALDPGNEQAVAGKQRIVVRLAELAQERRYAGEFDESLALIGQGLKIAPENETLLALKDDVKRRIKTRKEIAALLDKAEQQLGATRLTAPPGDNALESYRQVLKLEPRNETARAGLGRIADRYVQIARGKQQQGDLVAADVLVRKGLAVVPDHPELLSLQQAVQNAQRDQVLVVLLKRAEQQLENDQLTEPEGDNALESFLKVLERNPDDQRARNGIERVAERFAVLAQDRQREGKLSESLSLIGKGLTFAPKNRSLLALQEQIQQLLEARRQRDEQIAALLDSAEQMLDEGRLVTPEGDNAYGIYQKVLAFDQNNQQALAGIKQLVKRLAKLAGDRHENDQLTQSLALIDRGLGIAPKDSTLLALQEMVGRELEVQEREELVEKLFAQAETQLTNDKLLKPKGDNAYESFQQVLELVPGNERALVGLHRLGNHLIKRAREQLALGNHDNAQALVEQVEKVSPWHPRLADLKITIAATPEGKPLGDEKRLAQLLGKAQQQMASLKLTRPRGDNAYKTLQAVLMLDPDNRDAKAALSAIAERYAALARRRLQAGDTHQALAMVERGLEVDPHHRELLGLKEELTKPETAPDTKVASLLANAERQLAAGRATKPPGNNAFETLKEVLGHDPRNRQAQAGLRTIAAQYEVSIKAELKSGNLEGAALRIKDGLRHFRDHRQLMALREVLIVHCAKDARAAQQEGAKELALSTIEECLDFFPKANNLLALKDALLRAAPGSGFGAFQEAQPDISEQKQKGPSHRDRRKHRTIPVGL